MNTRLLLLGVASVSTAWLALLASIGIPNASPPSGDDERLIRAMVGDTIARLNKGDITAVAKYWDEAADYVSVDGR